MPAKKAHNKVKLTFLQMRKTASCMLAAKLTQQMMLVPMLLSHSTRSEITFPIDVVLKAIQDVKRDVQDFPARMDEAEVQISNAVDTFNSEKNKSDALVKQVTLLTNKLDKLENRSR